MTVKRIISGEVLKYRNGLRISGDYETRSTGASHFALTVPRQDLLGHRSGRITTHYSAAELSRLLDAANKICNRKGKQPELVVLRRLNVS